MRMKTMESIATEVEYEQGAVFSHYVLDGFIAGPGSDMSWLSEHLGPNPTVDEVIGKIGALLVDDPYKGTAREGKPFGGG